MCGNGRAVYGGKAHRPQVSDIHTIRQMGEKIWTLLMVYSVCYGAVRSRMFCGSRAAPAAFGTVRSTATGTSVFGWWCSHDSGLEKRQRGESKRQRAKIKRQK